MNDITPRGPKRPLNQQLSKRPDTPEASGQRPPAVPPPTDIDASVGLRLNDQKVSESPRRTKSRLKWILLGLATLIIIALIGAYLLYQYLLSPASSDTKGSKQVVQITEGQSPRQIVAMLEQKKLIRSAQALYVHMMLAGTSASIKAGSYTLSPSQSAPQILTTLTAGKADQLSVLIYPGSTLGLFKNTTEDQNVISSLRKVGFNDNEINTALTAQYSRPELFAGKPKDSSLIGYIYGETYTFPLGTSATTVVDRALGELESVVKKNDLAAKYKKQGLTLYQGITLASIVQREVTNPEDEKRVAGIFLKRLRSDAQLGSDVTYEYAAKLSGEPATPNLDSPYNTRKFKGLPPGPISNPGLSALLAVADPVISDNLYFLSGDDGKTYFATTNQQHEENIKRYCQRKCQL